ncbi:MAG: hypothetical protein IPP07_21060 [Holophagales bacterium]|jgi:hypothetical protein|nr:hypothetical protein [Holophagales bacterium]
MDTAKAGRHAEVATFGALHQGASRATAGWRRGVVTTILPYVVADRMLFFCAVYDGNTSINGDSGCLWIGHQAEGHYPAMGIHYGILNATGHVLVSDIASALPHVGIQELLGSR